MNNKKCLNLLPFSTESALDSLVENRRAYTLSNFELNIFETYQPADMVPLQFSDFSIINMIKGKKVMHLKDKVSFDYYPGETLLLPERSLMRIDFPEARLDEPTQCTAITISDDKIKEVLNYLNEFYPKKDIHTQWSFQLDKFHLTNSDELVQLTNRLFQVTLSGDQQKEIISDLVLKELMIRIMQTQDLLVLQDPTETDTPLFFKDIKQYIKENIEERIYIENLCDLVGMSKSALYRTFKAELGISPLEFVLQEKLIHAKKILKQTRSVKDACFSSGFSDVNYFIRLFKQREGTTPGVFAKLS